MNDKNSLLHKVTFEVTTSTGLAHEYDDSDKQHHQDGDTYGNQDLDEQ